MKRNLNSIFALIVLASFTLASTQSLAQTTAMVAETGIATGEYLNLLLPVNNSSQNYFVGTQNITVNGSSFLAFCIDPYQYSSGTPASYTVSNNLSSYLGSTQADQVSNLFSQSYASTTGSAANSAAFQLALWELANDNGNLKTGAVQAMDSNNTTVLAASTMITNAQTGSGSTQYSFNIYKNPTRQDFLVTVSAVPEPETYALLLAGLGLMGTVVRRRSQSRATV